MEDRRMEEEEEEGEGEGEGRGRSRGRSLGPEEERAALRSSLLM